MLKYLPYGGNVLMALALMAIAWFLNPRWKFVSLLMKREDVERGYVAGVRNYFLTVLLLVVIFSWKAPWLATAGWLALAWGDGAAGILGRRDSTKLPWSRRKTIVGFLSCIVFTFVAIAFSYVWTFYGYAQGIPPLSSGILTVFGATSIIVGLLESVDLPIDDNYVVGLGTPILLLIFLKLSPINAAL